MILESAKVAVRRRITALFNDAAKGERPILRRADALFAPDSVAWRANGDIVTMMIGGVSGLLLQMLHPAVLAGVWDHSNFRTDMHGRLRRTAKFIAVTTYDHAEHGLAAIDHVRGIHDRIGGVLPDGAAYQAGDPALLAWVHVTEAISFLDAWIRYAEPDMSLADQDRYFVEMALVADRLGADARTREVAQLVLNQSVGAALTDAASGIIMRAGVDLLPDWAREMHGLTTPPTAVVRAGAHALARTLGWAYYGSPNHEVWPAEITVWPRG